MKDGGKAAKPVPDSKLYRGQGKLPKEIAKKLTIKQSQKRKELGMFNFSGQKFKMTPAKREWKLLKYKSS